MANNLQLASDNFASGSLAAGWSAAFGSHLSVVVNNGSAFVAEAPDTATTCDSLWTALIWPNDQISEATIAALTLENGTNLALWVRVQSGSLSGYVLNLSQGNAILYRCDNGTFTSILNVSAAIASNDIWSLNVNGSVLSIYQNFVRVGYIIDYTYSGGAPGFRQSSSVNVTHSQLGSWRGYSAVQQDGVWKKQGIVISAIAVDGGTGIQDFQIFDTGAGHILSGTVFRALFTSNQGASAENYYAESLIADGKTWTRAASGQMSGEMYPFVFRKDAATLYAYTVTHSTFTFNLYQSTNDGQTWSLLASNIFSLGGVGTWDHGSIYYFQPFLIDTGGTWWAMYSGSTLVYGSYKIGLATSPDGQTWTRYVGNPVLSAPAAWSSGSIVNTCHKFVGSILYMWGFANQPGLGGPNPLIDPGECVRWQSADNGKTWSNPVHSVHRSNFYEGLNNVGGQSFPNAIADVGGKTYLWIQSAYDDSSSSTQGYQISLAIAPTTIASLVQFNEDGTQQVATDNFTSGAGDLSANWTLPTGGTKLKIVSGPFVEPTVTSVVCQAVYTGASFGVNQYSEITLQALTGTLAQSLIWPTVRSSPTALTNYEGWIASPSATSDAAAAIYKRVAGTPVQIGPTATIDPQVGDVFRLSVVTGSDGFPTLSLYQNGFLILQVQDSSSTPITTGNPGIQAFSSVAIADAQMSSWAGGNANVIPAFSAAYSWIGVDLNNSHCGLRH